MTRAHDFLTTFAKLEKEIRARASKVPPLAEFRPGEQYKRSETYAGSLVVLQSYGKDRVVLEYMDQLRLYGQLRNALAHNYDDEPIADPREDTVAGIRTLYEKVTNPQKVSQIMTPSPTTFDSTMDVYDALGTMNIEWFTSVPVYHEGVLAGVLSERSALRWAAASKDDAVKLAEPKTLEDILQYFDIIDDAQTDLYVFVAKDLDVYSVRDMFDTAIRDGKRMSAVFVTHNGNKTEKLLGIVTAWDLHRIDD